MKELPYSLDPTEMKHGPSTSVSGFLAFCSSWDLNQLMVNMVDIYIYILTLRIIGPSNGRV